MARVVIQEESRGGETPWSTELGEGQEATFGRGTPHTPVTMTLADPAISRLAGSIVCCRGHWEISNLSATTFLIEDLESGGYVKVGPGRIRAPIPFELARVSLPARHGSASFLVFAPEHEHLYDPGDPAVTGVTTQQTSSLSRQAKYFYVLVALCEPQLLDRSSVVIPSIPEVVARLGGIVPSADAAYFHLDYLARTKLRLSGPQSDRRAVLVAWALRYDLVREEDLRLLPRR